MAFLNCEELGFGDQFQVTQVTRIYCKKPQNFKVQSNSWYQFKIWNWAINVLSDTWDFKHWKSMNVYTKCILCWTCNEFKFVALQLPVIWILNMKHKMLQILHYILNIKSLGLSKLIAAFTIDQVTWWFPQFEKAYWIHNLPNY